ncbi:MAG TPA: hypothetical protein VEW42_02205 [Candidatus Eisenbacteria bacterium]|nr:hypothetical protein [Candidatus Eisenbacteria bacterium]
MPKQYDMPQFEWVHILLKQLEQNPTTRPNDRLHMQQGNRLVGRRAIRIAKDFMTTVPPYLDLHPEQEPRVTRIVQQLRRWETTYQNRQ